MNKFKMLLTVMLALLLSSCFKESQDQYIEYVHPGSKVPVFSCVLNTGDTIRTDRLTRPLVIVFFNTSCKDCQRELPVINDCYERGVLPSWLGGSTAVGRMDADGIPPYDIACISREEGWESVAAFWRAHNLSMPYSAQLDRSVYSLFASGGIPRIYLVDADGIVCSTYFPAN